MPSPGKQWRHVIINTRGTWLPGDPRGFRNRGHRIHSSGDYRNPPPPEEHQGLYRYNHQRSAQPVRIPASLRAAIAGAMVSNLTEHDHRLLVLSVSAPHAHLLVELPTSMIQTRTAIGWCKQKSSAAAADTLPGRIWAAGASIRPVRDRAHLLAVYRYILRHRDEGAWTWSFTKPSLNDPVPKHPA